MKTNMTDIERQKIIDKGNILMDNTLFADFYSMEDSEIALLMRSIGKYVGLGEIQNFSKEQRIVQMAFNRFKVSHDANCRKYLDTCKKRSENKIKDWEKKRQKED